MNNSYKLWINNKDKGIKKMINEEANKSWAIRTYTDELLNFIIFTGCMYNLIDNQIHLGQLNYQIQTLKIYILIS